MKREKLPGERFWYKVRHNWTAFDWAIGIYFTLMGSLLLAGVVLICFVWFTKGP